MIQIDGQKIDSRQFADKLNELSRLEPLRMPEGKAYAICVKDALEVIALAAYLRRQGGTVLLFHADTPFETAKQMALHARCSYLLYGHSSRAHPLADADSRPVPGLLQFSSGTTGQPKLIFRSWSEVEEEHRAYCAALGADSGEPSLILVPVSHSFGLLAGVFGALERGAGAIVVQSRNPKFQLRMIGEAERSIVYAVPYLVHLLLSLGKEELRFHKLVSSGAPLTDQLLDRLSARSQVLYQQYGCTEAGCISLGGPPATRWDMGRVLSHLKAGIKAAQPGEPGEIIVEKPGGERILTRDLGALTEDGRLQMFGRLDDLINVGGLKVIPSEVEDAIESLPGVRESVVFRARHPVWGEAAKACIVADKEVTEGEVKAWCISRLPAYKIPAFIEIVPELPRLPSGKISRKHMEEQERIKYGK